MGQPVSLACEPGVSVAVGCNALCMVFRGEHDAAYPERVFGWTRAAADHLGVTAVPAFILIEDHAESPDADARRRYSTSLTRSAPILELFAHVILASGFKGVAFRAISSTIALVARSATVNKVFADVKTASQWVATDSKVCREEAEDLSAFVEAVRRA